jgi:hypothetical protein
MSHSLEGQIAKLQGLPGVRTVDWALLKKIRSMTTTTDYEWFATLNVRLPVTRQSIERLIPFRNTHGGSIFYGWDFKSKDSRLDALSIIAARQNNMDILLIPGRAIKITDVNSLNPTEWFPFGMIDVMILLLMGYPSNSPLIACIGDESCAGGGSQIPLFSLNNDAVMHYSEMKTVLDPKAICYYGSTGR